MTRNFETTLIFDGGEVNTTFDLKAESDLDGYHVEITFGTYGPLFRDDFSDEVAAQIDSVVLKNLEDSGKLDQILSEMEFDCLEATFERK
jgi:hypothetical protein